MTSAQDLQKLWDQAAALHQGGRLAQAEQLYLQVLAAEPRLAAGWNVLGSLRAQQGRVAEALADFDRAVALKPAHAEAHANRAHALWALGRLEEAVTAYDRSLAVQPGDPQLWNYRGGALAQLNRLDDALASFVRAAALKPDHVEALNNQGVILQILRRFDESLAVFDRALAAKPDHAEALNGRAATLSEMENFAAALANVEKAIALQPAYTEAHYNHGGILADLGRFEDAVASYDRALALKPDYAEAQYNQSLCRLLLGQFEKGWAQYEWRKRRRLPITLRNHPQPHWLGEEDISGKQLFLYWEQGLGDTIQLCRYARMAAAKGARVVLSVQTPLVGLLQQLGPEVEVIGKEDTPPHFDFQSSLMSMPLAFGGAIPSAPYLHPEPELAAQWADRLPPKTRPRIGLVWSGGQNHRNDHNRSMPFETLAPLLGPQADWVCLQKEIRDIDIAAVRRHGKVTCFGNALRDFRDTAALASLMDLVISVDTAVAHMAGALGQPVWILLAQRPDWRWQLERDDSPWYPSARLFRQQRRGDWAGVIARLQTEIAAIAPG